MFDQIKNFILDFVFPVRCVGCRCEGGWFCCSCVAKIRINSVQNCPVCWGVSVGGQTCSRCQRQSVLAGLRVAASYEANPELKSAVRTLKYKFSKPLAKNLAEILMRVIQQTSHAGERVITFVPLHSRRQRWRGFNQAELLARAVGQRLDLPVEDLLVRSQNTVSQAKLKRAERLNNLTGAFALAGNSNIQNKTVILVDDVASTGATLSECAQVLRAAGAREVWGLVLARG